jgi:hypothetical protein
MSAYLLSYNRFSVIFLVAVFLGSASFANAQEFDHAYTLYDGVIKAHVKDGLVDYAALKADPEALDQYLNNVAKLPEKQFNSWDNAQRLAFLFNLYNVATLRLILDHYPVKSIKDIGSIFKGPFDQPVVRLFGKTITLNALEHDILRKQYNEPRLHLALVCAAKGCPPLRSEAYKAKRLYEQLDDQSKRFIGNPAKFRIDRRKGVVYFSKIFKWYGDDFLGKYSPTTGFTGLNETERAVANFCARNLSEEDRKYLESGGYTFKFLDYDWSLNERKKQP